MLVTTAADVYLHDVKQKACYIAPNENVFSVIEIPQRIEFGISLRDKICNKDIGKRTRVIDIAFRITTLNWQW